MNTHEIPWLPADDAPTLQPLLCYWAPFPEAEEPEARPELWAVAVRRKVGSIDRWHMYQPLWEGGCGYAYEDGPDFYMPVVRPDGDPKWVVSSDDSVAYLKGYNSTEDSFAIDTDPERIAASRASMPRLGIRDSTIPHKVDGCGGEEDAQR